VVLRTQIFKVMSLIALQKLCIVILVLTWIPLLFINFDSHHDGLMLTTVNSLRRALGQSGAWPFNQYGSFWAFPYVLFSYLFPSQLTYFSMRLLAVFCYLTSAYLLLRLAKLINKESAGYWAVIAFLGSQPFISDFGSDLVPWPSSIAMPLMLLLTIHVVKIGINPGSTPLGSAFLAGLIVACLALSRLQIGLALFLSLSFYFIVFFRTSVRWIFPLGFLISVFFFSVFLQTKGWLRDSIFDEIVFASNYVRGDKSTYPSPVFTFAGTVFFLLLLCVTPKAVFLLKRGNFKKSAMVILGLTLILMVATSTVILNQRGLNGTDIVTTISRRTWITLTLAALVFATVRQFYRTLNFLIRRQKIIADIHVFNLLVGIACVAQLQVWPLFDQMHFWWGSVPSILVMVIVLTEFKNVFQPTRRISLIGRFLIPLAVLLAVFIPWVSQVGQPKRVFLPHYINFIKVPSVQAQNQKNLQEFFHATLKPGESILNFCDNTDVFFDGNFLHSASRIFLLWPGFREVGEYRMLLTSAKFSSVITCSLLQMPMYREASEKDQALLIQSLGTKLRIVASFKENGGRTWRIWKPAG
jgi:hypothetical protein